MGATIIAAIRGSRANRAGSVFERQSASDRAVECLSATSKEILGGERMPRGRSTFTKRQKENTRQQRQRDKAERRSQRKQEKAPPGRMDEMAELREHAAEQAALFNLDAEDADAAERSTSHGGGTK